MSLIGRTLSVVDPNNGSDQLEAIVVDKVRVPLWGGGSKDAYLVSYCKKGEEWKAPYKTAIIPPENILEILML